MPYGMPPQIDLRSARDILGITLEELAERINEQGVTVTVAALSNIETGKRRASERLIEAWARALHTRPIRIRQEREILDWAHLCQRNSRRKIGSAA